MADGTAHYAAKVGDTQQYPSAEVKSGYSKASIESRSCIVMKDLSKHQCYFKDMIIPPDKNTLKNEEQKL